MKITFSWDDGALQDLKLMELHEKYEIPGMFFVPTHNCEGRQVLSPNMIKNAESQYVSFGGHTENHKYLTTLSLMDAEEEIKNNKIYLENILSHEVDSFCFPGGRYNNELILAAKKYYKYLRTADTMNFSMPKDGLLKPSFHFYPRGKKSLLYNALKHKSYLQFKSVVHRLDEPYFDILKFFIMEREQNFNCISVWGHSWEIEQLDLWNELENVFLRLKNIDCITFDKAFEDV